ncbi:MAG: hypothetical protein FJW63_07895 [Actinobacteria bacterium]|nr:hypothetical protein [Actinomycetota bacterium]
MSQYFDGEQIPDKTFEYIRKCHQDLWDFVRIAFPWANGQLDGYIDKAKQHLKYLTQPLEG